MITKEQWKIIDEPVKARMSCSCKPLCEDCKKAMMDSQELHTKYKRKTYVVNQETSTYKSKSLMWYEVTFTFPNKNLIECKIAIEKLKKYSQYKYIDGRFEIGKSGLYHMHFLIKTNKYLRFRDVKKINHNKVSHLSRLRGKDGLKFQNYIEKDHDVKKPVGWDINFNE